MALAFGLDERDVATFADALRLPVLRLDDLAAVVGAARHDRDLRLVVLGPALAAADVLRCATEVRAARPGAVVVLLRAALNRLERHVVGSAGVDAVLPATDLAAAARSCLEFLAARAAWGQGRVVTVHAGKGGCGTTTVAVNLAVALAQDAEQRVCLVDLDLRSGNVGVTVGLEPHRTLASAQAAADLPDAVVTPLQPGLDCVLAPALPAEAERLDVGLVASVLDALTPRYDVVVVDTPPVVTRLVMSALDRSEHHVLVTTPERPALLGLRRTLDTLDLLGHRRDVRSVVFNRSDSRVGLTAADAERMLRAPIAAHVPSSRDVAASINSCLPLTVSSPDHPVSSAVRHLARTRLAPPIAVPRLPAGGAVT
ncbi:CpaE family protein [Geodermatophilus sp. SYSU D01062]